MVSLVGLIWGSYWNHFEIILDHVCIILGLFWDRFGIVLGSFWDHFGIILEHVQIVLDDLLIILGIFLVYMFGCQGALLG